MEDNLGCKTTIDGRQQRINDDHGRKTDKYGVRSLDERRHLHGIRSMKKYDGRQLLIRDSQKKHQAKGKLEFGMGVSQFQNLF